MIVESDFLVIGSGIAGLSFALKASEFGSVAIVTKKEDKESNTNYAQGGIASVLDWKDSFESHIEDTLVAGDGLCKRKAVEIIVRSAPEVIQNLTEIGVQFSSKNGIFDLGREGGHSANRIVHAQDLTGKEIERALLATIRTKSNISLFEHHFTLDLLTSENGDICCGATVLDTISGAIKSFHAKAVMLCTGGCGAIYLHTTNPAIATGDGIAMAFRAGAKVANLEFMQFHPTSLFHPKAGNFLISEALRGFGGVLKLRDGSEFMQKYHPLGSLAPRDIVARAIAEEMRLNNEECVFLDMRHLDTSAVKLRFPYIYERCLALGIDITQSMIPVVPAAHYMCGGVLTDLNAQSSIQGLFVCGETACTGVHGANRLASNSLLEAVVFANRALLVAKDFIENRDFSSCELSFSQKIIPPDSQWIAKQKLSIQTILWKNVGIIRTSKMLQEADTKLLEIFADVSEAYNSYKITVELSELRNIIQTARLIVRCALMRKESRGLHSILDFPAKNNEQFLQDTILTNKILR